MVGAGLYPLADRTVNVAISSNFVTAFISLTNPVFSYAVSPLCSICGDTCAVADSLSGPFHVLHPHLRDAPPPRRHESGLDAPSLRHRLLRRLRLRALLVHRQRRRLPRLQLFTDQMAKGSM